MKILFWSDAYLPYYGGIENVTKMLASAMTDRGHEVAVVTSHFDLTLPDHEELDGIPVHRFPFRKAVTQNDVRSIASILIKIAALKRAFQPDLIHMQLHAVSSFFHMQTLGAWTCPTLLTVHGEYPKCSAGSETLLGKLLEHATWITGVSQAVLDNVRSMAPATQPKSSLIYNAVRTPPVSHEARDHAQPLIFACGRLVEDKGFDLLIQAFHEICTEMPAAHLVIAGEGEEHEALTAQVRQLGLTGSVELPGWLSQDDLWKRMATATLLVIPSRRREGLPLVALEGALIGMPILATRVAGLPEIIVNGETGLLVEAEDPTALRAAIRKVLASVELQRQLGETARRTVQARFDPGDILAQYEDLYQRTYQKRNRLEATG